MMLAVGVFSACKKDKKTTGAANTSPTTGSTLDLIRDSIYLYAKEDYYWNTFLPDYNTFNPRSFAASTDIAALTNEVNALSQYAINPATTLPYEYYAPSPGEAKYSFIDDGTVSASLGGTNGDFGFSVFYNAYNDLRIKYVYAGSPGATAGLVRGYQVTAVNDSTNIAYNPTSTDPNKDPNLLMVVKALSQSKIKLTLKKPDGSSFTVTINTGSYSVNPVLKSTIISAANGHKIGYIVFNSFTVPTVAQPVLDPVFSNFAANGVTDLVVDLRYNGGGSVATAEYLDNLIAPASVGTSSVMYNTYFNANLTSNNTPILSHQAFRGSDGKLYNYGQLDYSVAGNQVKFSKAGALNVSRVFFIVTGGTASASELTINNLRPYMNVQLIGRTTYGKPVGFFALNINKYQYYTPEFETKNSAGQGGFYTGMVPGSSSYPGVADQDDVTKDWGDPTDRLLAHAISYVNTGTFAVHNPKVTVLALNRQNATGTQDMDLTISQALDHHPFNGMVLKALKIKKK